MHESSVLRARSICVGASDDSKPYRQGLSRAVRAYWAVDERDTELLVVVWVPQLPQRHGDVVDPVPESAVVEVDDPDVVAPEQQVVEMQIGVDEADLVGGVAQLCHHAFHAGGHPAEPAPEVTGNEIPGF